MSCACHASFFEPKPCVLCPLETGMTSPVFIAFIARDVIVHPMSLLSDSSGQRIGEVLPLKERNEVKLLLRRSFLHLLLEDPGAAFTAET